MIGNHFEIKGKGLMSTIIDIVSGSAAAESSAFIQKLVNEEYSNESVLIVADTNISGIDSLSVKGEGALEINTVIPEGKASIFTDACIAGIPGKNYDRCIVASGAEIKLSDLIESLDDSSIKDELLAGNVIVVVDGALKNEGPRDIFEDRIESGELIVVSRPEGLDEKALLSTVRDIESIHYTVPVITTSWKDLEAHRILGCLREDTRYNFYNALIHETFEGHHHGHDHGHEGCCGGEGHGHDHGDEGCCGGKGHEHDHGDEGCCGGKGHEHDHGDKGCCGGEGHEHDHGDEGCCGGKGHEHDHGDKGCCGEGHDHDHGEEGCCGGKGHEHDHGDEGCCGGKGHEHDHGDEGCCGGEGHGHDHGDKGCCGGKGHEHDHGDKGCCGEHDHDHEEEGVLDVLSFETPYTFSLEGLTGIMNSIAKEEFGQIMKGKGVLPLDDGKWILFDYEEGKVQVTESIPHHAGRICFIGLDLDDKKFAENFGGH
jgi:G3E family GTPase